MARVLPHTHAIFSCARPLQMDKPTWINALEESLLLAIGLFSLITWIVIIGLLGH